MRAFLSKCWSWLGSLRRSDEEYLADLEAAELAEDSYPFAREDRSTGLWNEGPGGEPGSGG
jgi:hypothetical protein